MLLRARAAGVRAAVWRLEPKAARSLATSRKTASSSLEHLYGASSVLPALQAGRRKLKTLYVKEAETFEKFNRSEEQDSTPVVANAIEWAQRREIRIVRIPPSRLNALSDGRPNQGVVLAASALSCTQVKHLGMIQETSSEEISYSGLVTKKESFPLTFVPHVSERSFPIWLALDQVVDPQNLGAILRTAKFMNIDGVVLTEHESAPLSPVVSKASAGALETMEKIYSTSNLKTFLEESAMNGWHIYGTDINADNSISLSSYLRERSSNKDVPQLLHAPTVLVVGNEGVGLRAKVSDACHDHLIIGSVPDTLQAANAYQVESLNVSVATGILLHALCTSE
ncbi:Alpha/beta knot methyltransferase [Phlyctochytrium arcticum]|nr:Alpha/beta knot methyltransferase [Phlyctochytrium arcticum]